MLGNFFCFRHRATQIRKFSEAYLLISKQLTFCPQKSDENRSPKSDFMRLRTR